MIVDGIEYKKCDKCGKMCAKLEMVNWKTCKECVISELKANIEARKYAMTMSEKVEKKLRKENEELLQKVKGYDRNRDRLIAMGFPTFKSCKEYAEKLKELEAQIEKMKNCKNCANYMISDKCPCFFRTGWCKNWEMAKGVRCEKEN